LALGAWGAVQATAAGLAIAVGGVIRDVIDSVYQAPLGYEVVYAIEVVLLLVTVLTMMPLVKKSPQMARN
jgi:BCD family chlorophyll transporter-like MFS transporter